jgi:hypothetical protein
LGEGEYCTLSIPQAIGSILVLFLEESPIASHGFGFCGCNNKASSEERFAAKKGW